MVVSTLQYSQETMRAFDEGEALFGRCLQLRMDENLAPFLVSFSFIVWIQPEKYAAVFLKLQITSKQNLLNNSSRWLIIIHIMAETPPSMLFPVVPSKSLCFPPDFLYNAFNLPSNLFSAPTFLFVLAVNHSIDPGNYSASEFVSHDY